MDKFEKSLEEVGSWYEEAKDFADLTITQSLNQARKRLEGLEISSQQWEEKMRQIGLPAEALEKTIEQQRVADQKLKEKIQGAIERLEALLRDRTKKE